VRSPVATPRRPPFNILSLDLQLSASSYTAAAKLWWFCGTWPGRAGRARGPKARNMLAHSELANVIRSPALPRTRHKT